MNKSLTIVIMILLTFLGYSIGVTTSGSDKLSKDIQRLEYKLIELEYERITPLEFNIQRSVTLFDNITQTLQHKIIQLEHERIIPLESNIQQIVVLQDDIAQTLSQESQTLEYKIVELEDKLIELEYERINPLGSNIQRIATSQDRIARTLLQESQTLMSALQTLRQESATAEQVSATLFGRDVWSAGVKKVLSEKAITAQDKR